MPVAEEKPPAKAKKFKFKVLHGAHAQREPVLDNNGHPRNDEAGEQITDVKTYEQGSIVESDIDLAKLHNSRDSQKFEAIAAK